MSGTDSLPGRVLSFRDVIEREYGTEAADRIFHEAGYLAGEEFYKNTLGEHSDLGEFIKTLQTALRELGIGILRTEESDPGNGRFVLTVSEATNSSPYCRAWTRIWRKS